MHYCETRLDLFAEIEQAKQAEAWSKYEEAYFKYIRARVKVDDYADAIGYLDSLYAHLQRKLSRIALLRNKIKEETQP